MLLTDLPGSYTGAWCSSAEGLESVLVHNIYPLLNYTHSLEIGGTAQSVFLFLTRAYQTALPFPEPRLSIEIALDLMEARKDARYSEQLPLIQQERGWEVRRMTIKREPATLAIASWVYTG
mgnify:CR=1 FL=1